MKLYDSPYQSEVCEAQKDNVFKDVQKSRDEIDNEIALWMSKALAFFMAIGVIYLLFKE